MPVPLRIVRSTKRAGLVALALTALAQAALAADKPPLAPDPPAPLATASRVSATIEFGLPALAKAIEQDIPKRLATIDERVNCVHRRVLMFRVNANCNIWGYVERSGPVSLYGRGDRVYGSVPIHGVLEGQGANRFTSRIHGETEDDLDAEGFAPARYQQDRWYAQLGGQLGLTKDRTSGIIRAAGFIDMGMTDGGEHSRPSRYRKPAIRPEPKN